MTGRANLWPRFSSLADRFGRLGHSWRGFFSRLYRRTGPAINGVLPVSPLADMGRAVNAILAELRAQGWIDADSRSAAGGFLADQVKAICMIPAATEFGYDTREIRSGDGGVVSFTENAYESPAVVETGQETNFITSLNQLEANVANCEAVSLFVTWFGDDLRCGECTVKPKVTRRTEELTTGYPNPGNPVSPIPADWRVAGMVRDDADLVSTVPPFDRPAYGGTPSDASVIRAIREMNVRGYKVSFTPFLLMDVPAGNTLTDPYDGSAGQPVHPWRGRITCSPAPGQPGSPDKTAAAAAQVADFVGTAGPGDFFTVAGPVDEDEVIYSGTPEWSYRRFILHYAHLCALAGGVDVFVIASEMRGLTWVRDGATSHPFVAALAAIAADVKTILPAAKVIYAADWSEYHSYQPQDGSGDLIFHLDPLYASPAIDAIGIDVYFPLSDWRNGDDNLDASAGWASIYDIGYLQAGIFGGEGYDWFYASQADRDAQSRTPITDGAYGKPWVFRYKDLRNWWSSRHYNRIGGVEQPDPTPWTPEAKPVWFTELGCPAVDKGSNQPNVFVDPNSSESAYPYYSSEARDDLIQKRYCHAWLRYLDEDGAEFAESNNPRSSVYDGRMIDTARIYFYTWDARPYPQFPELNTIWADGDNWQFGHWLTGRLAAPPPVQAAYSMALLDARAPRAAQIIDPRSGAITPPWREFFEAISFTRGEAIDDLSSEPSAAELAETINAILAVLRAQRRIG